MINERSNITRQGHGFVSHIGRIDSRNRDRINAARVACVLMMMYVHVPNGLHSGNEIEQTLNIRLDHWLESIFIEGPGRASAALLSVVSGYLIAFTLARSGGSVWNLYRARFVSIVLPMVFWACLTCAVYWMLDPGSDSFIRLADSWFDKLNLVTFITEAPYGATLHLAFLRDLFVCVLLSPLLLLALNRFPVATLSMLGFIYLVEHSGQLYIILRPLVVLGFSMGMLLALRGVRLDALDKHWGLYWWLMVFFTMLIIWTDAGLLNSLESGLAELGVSLKESILYPLCRLSGSLAIWCTYPVWQGAGLTRVANRLVPYLFVAFCSHFLVLTLLFNGLWMPLAGDRDSYFYILWFLSAPLIALLVSIVMVNITARIFPHLAILITGGRVTIDTPGPIVSGKLVQMT